MSTAATTNCSTRVHRMVVKTPRKPTSPNQAQSTYTSTRRAPPSSTTSATAPTISSVFVRRDSWGVAVGGRLATGSLS